MILMAARFKFGVEIIRYPVKSMNLYPFDQHGCLDRHVQRANNP